MKDYSFSIARTFESQLGINEHSNTKVHKRRNGNDCSIKSVEIKI